MSERNRNPDPHPVLDRLKKADSDNETEDVISVVGFVGPRDPEGPLRLFADEEGQRYLEIPFEDFVDAEPIPDDERMRIYVNRQVMVEDAFEADVLDALGGKLVGPPMSLWQFLPENRLVAAGMLGMLPDYEGPDHDEEEATA